MCDCSGLRDVGGKCDGGLSLPTPVSIFFVTVLVTVGTLLHGGVLGGCCYSFV